MSALSAYQGAYLMEQLTINVVKLREEALLPVRATEFSAGYDIFSAEDLEIKPLERVLIKTGLAIEIPYGYEGQVRPRSGLSYKQGIIIPNSPGTIDADYRGELQVIVFNSSQDVFQVHKGMRIAQLVIKPILNVTFEEVEELSDTKRGDGGFGSTGK